MHALSGRNKVLGRDSWKVRKVNEILGVPQMDSGHVDPNMLIDLRECLKGIDYVEAVIIYGSVVTGESSPNSDIDLMVFLAKGTDEDMAQKVLMHRFLDIERRYRSLLYFSTYYFTGEEDTHFLWDVARDGVVIYCKPEKLLHPMENLVAYSLISYSLKGLDPNEKKRVQRFLFDSPSGANINKEYGRDYVAPGVLLLPVERAKPVLEFFDALNVSHGSRKVWI